MSRTLDIGENIRAVTERLREAGVPKRKARTMAEQAARSAETSLNKAENQPTNGADRCR